LWLIESSCMYFPGKISHFLENGGIWMINHHIFKVFSFKLQNYKMRLKQIRLNWIISMQVKNIIFTNVFFPWSLCLKHWFENWIFRNFFLDIYRSQTDYTIQSRPLRHPRINKFSLYCKKTCFIIPRHIFFPCPKSEPGFP
jgi:sulfatase maturation enzyme AslB (radical SAM superfamily)